METRAQSGGSSGSPDGGDGEEAQEASVLPLHRILTVHTSNEYTEGPVATPGRSRAADPVDEGAMQDGTSPGRFHVSHNSRDLQDSMDLQDSRLSSQGARSPQSVASRSTSGTSEGSFSNSSEQRLLGNTGRTIVETVQVVQMQPKQAEAKQEELKPLTVTSGSGKQHSQRCECKGPQSLPSCWLCGQRCLCSPESTVDYATCACCLKALFYHCSSDDEDTCTDKPFSCSQPKCCLRYSVAGALSLLLPCLLCYLPALGCLALCEACYNCAHRPRCRCRNAEVSHLKKNKK